MTQGEDAAGMESFGERLRILREERNLSQEALGVLVGKNKSGISKLEKGRQEPSLREAMQFATIFHMLLSQFLGEEKDEHERQRQARIRQVDAWLARGRVDLVKRADQIKHDTDQLKNTLEMLTF